MRNWGRRLVLQHLNSTHLQLIGWTNSNPLVAFCYALSATSLLTFLLKNFVTFKPTVMGERVPEFPNCRIAGRVMPNYFDSAMQQIRFILIVCLLFIGHTAFACTCGSSGEFLTVAPNSDFVALIKVTKYLSFEESNGKQIPMSMEVEVVEVYRGKEKRKRLKVWGDNGILCRPYISRFDTGRYYVIAFFKASDGSEGYVHQDERPTDYAISICGDYWLIADIEKQKAVGIVTSKEREIGFLDLRRKLVSE